MEIDYQSFVEGELSHVLGAIPIRLCSKYVDVFSKRRSELLELGDADTALVFLLLAQVSRMWLDNDSDEALQPFMLFSESPQNIEDNSIEILNSLLPLMQDAELQARIADILWLRNRDYRSGKQAIRSYLDSARNLRATDQEHWFVYVVERLNRAIQLARRLNDQEGLQSVVVYLQELLAQSEADSHAPLHLLILLEKHKLLKDRASEFSILLRQSAIRMQKEDEWQTAQSYWNIAAKWYQVDNNIEGRDQALIASAECDVRKAQSAAQEVPPRYIAACAYLERAITTLRRLRGQQARIDELLVLLNRYGEESIRDMKEHSFSVDIASIAKRAREAVSGLNFHDALFKWAHLTAPPRLDDLRTEAKANITQFPLRFLASSRVLNSQGKVVAHHEGGDLESDETLMYEVQGLVRLHHSSSVAALIGPALYQMNLEHNIRVQDVMPILKHNPFVPSGHEEIYARGLVAGLRDDGLVAAHLLLPQLESSLREVLVLRGKITSALNNELVQDEYPLSAIIYWPELSEVLGEDLIFNLRALLVERHGSNLRNLTAHGLLTHEEFRAYAVTYLTWITMRLLFMPILYRSVSQETQNRKPD